MSRDQNGVFTIQPQQRMEREAKGQGLLSKYLKPRDPGGNIRIGEW